MENDKKHEIHSARSNLGKNNGKSAGNSKNLDFGNKFNAGNVSQSNPYVSSKDKDKKKKIEAFKRR